MARLGRYEYPESGLQEAVGVARAIARGFGGEVSRGGLARALGMSERGGAFAARLGAARLWGVCTGRGTVRLTPEGLRAAEPRSVGEAESARRSLARSVQLFGEIGRRTGGRVVDESRLAVLLEEITGAGRLEVGRRVGLIARLVNEVLPYLAPETPGEAERETRAPDARGSPVAVGALPETGGTAGATNGGEDRIELLLPGGRLSLPESVAGLDAAMLVLQARREALVERERASGVSRPPERPF